VSIPKTTEGRNPHGCIEFDPKPNGYGALVERDATGESWVCHGGIPADRFIHRAQRNARNGWGAVAIGRIDPHRPDDPPGKVPWHRGFTGRDGRDPTSGEIAAWPGNVIHRILAGERGILNLGARVPSGVVALDVDHYGPKRGLDTLAEHEGRRGQLPLTYLVTARPYETGSGIRLYQVPHGWEGAGELRRQDGSAGHVELLQRHHRFLTAPGSLHHTGRRYSLWDQRTDTVVKRPLPPRRELPMLPEAWLHDLHRKPRQRGMAATREEVAAFAQECTFDDCPRQLGKTVQRVRDATGDNETRPAYHRALFIAARKARAGCYPWERAVVEIERAAREVYTLRGRQLDAYDFARSVEHAVTEAMDLPSDEVARWGPPPSMDLSGWQTRVEQAR